MSSGLIFVLCCLRSPVKSTRWCGPMLAVQKQSVVGQEDLSTNLMNEIFDFHGLLIPIVYPQETVQTSGWLLFLSRGFHTSREYTATGETIMSWLLQLNENSALDSWSLITLTCLLG